MYRDAVIDASGIRMVSSARREEHPPNWRCQSEAVYSDDLLSVAEQKGGGGGAFTGAAISLKNVFVLHQ